MATKIGSLYGEVLIDTRKMEKGLKRASRQLNQFGRNATNLGKGMGLSIGAPLAALAVSSTKAFATFEKGSKEVRTLLGDISDQDFNQLTQGVKELSKTFGTDLKTNIDAAYQAISAGVPADNLLSFLETATKAGIGGVTDTATAVDGLTTVINAYGLEIGEAAKISDQMFTAVRLGKTTFEELSGFMFQAVPLAAKTGVAFDELMASVIGLTKQGTPTRVAMTQIRAAISNLQKPTKEMQAAFDNLNVKTATQLISKNGFVGALDAIVSKAGLTETELSKAFGSVEALSAVLSLTGDKLHVTADALEQVRNSAGASDAAFQEMTTSLDTSFGKLQESVQVLLISLGEELEPTVRELTERFTEFISENEDLVIAKVKSTAKVAAFLAVLSGGFFTIGHFALLINNMIQLHLLNVRIMTGSVIPAILRLRKAFVITALAVQLSITPLMAFKAIIVAIAAIAFGIKIADEFDLIKKAAEKLGVSAEELEGELGYLSKTAEGMETEAALLQDETNALNTSLGDAGNAAEGMATSLENLATSATKSSEELKSLRDEASELLGDMLEAHDEATEVSMDEVVGLMGKHDKKLKKSQKQILQIFKGMTEASEESTKVPMEDVLKSMDEYAEKNKTVKQAMREFAKGGKSAAEMVQHAMERASDGMTDAIHGAMKGNKESVREFVADFLDQTAKMIIQTQVVDKALRKMAGVLGGQGGEGDAQGQAQGQAQQGKGLIENLKTAFSDIGGKLKSSLGGAASMIGSKLMAGGNFIGSSMGNALNMGGNFLSSTLGGAFNMGGNFLSSTLAGAFQMGGGLLSNVISGALSALGGLGGMGGGLLGGIGSFFGGFFADGGNFSAGKPIVVGERGPEMIMPRTGGTVVPNHAMAAGGPVNVNFRVDAVDAQSFNSHMVKSKELIVGMIDQAYNKRGAVGVNG